MKNPLFTKEKSCFQRESHRNSLFAKLNSLSPHKSHFQGITTCQILYFVLLQRLASTSESIKVRTNHVLRLQNPPQPKNSQVTANTFNNVPSRTFWSALLSPASTSCASPIRLSLDQLVPLVDQGCTRRSTAVQATHSSQIVSLQRKTPFDALSCTSCCHVQPYTAAFAVVTLAVGINDAFCYK